MHPVLALISRLAVFLLECLVRGYQVILSPLLIGTCKFFPTCSDYFIQAVREWGPLRGSWLGIRRLLRCHPFGQGGLDPVPRRSSLRGPESKDSPSEGDGAPVKG